LAVGAKLLVGADRAGGDEHQCERPDKFGKEFLAKVVQLGSAILESLYVGEHIDRARILLNSNKAVQKMPEEPCEVSSD
jgi:hypothetical protein